MGTAFGARVYVASQWRERVLEFIEPAMNVPLPSPSVTVVARSRGQDQKGQSRLVLRLRGWFDCIRRRLLYVLLQVVEVRLGRFGRIVRVGLGRRRGVAGVGLRGARCVTGVRLRRATRGLHVVLGGLGRLVDGRPGLTADLLGRALFLDRISLDRIALLRVTNRRR